MADNIIKTRIQLKYDSYERWTASANQFVLKKGEVAIATLAPFTNVENPTADSGQHPVLFKVGDGAKTFNQLPWASALAADVHAWAKKSEEEFKAWLPTLIPVEVVDNGTGKFVTDVTAATTNGKHVITISRDDAVNTLNATDDDIVILTVDKNKGDVIIDGKHKEYNGAGTTTDTSSNLTEAGKEITIKVPSLTVDKYGHTVLGTETSHTIKLPGEIAVGDGEITIEAGKGLTDGGTFNVNQDTDGTITLNHKDAPTSGNAATATSGTGRTYVTEVLVDDMGHIAGVKTATETVVDTDTNTAHTHTAGTGLKITGNGGIDGNVEYAIDEDYLRDTIGSQTTAAMEFKGATSTLPATDTANKGDMYKVSGEFTAAAANDAQGVGFTAKIGDSIVYEDEGKWYLIPSGDDIEDTWRPVKANESDIPNTDTIKFADGNHTTVETSRSGEVTTIMVNHDAPGAGEALTPSNDGTGRTYITEISVDDYGHITGAKTATETVTDTHHTAKNVVTNLATGKTNATATNGNVKLNLVENDTVRSTHKIVGTGKTTVTSDGDGNITINTPDTDISGKLDANGWQTSQVIEDGFVSKVVLEYDGNGDGIKLESGVGLTVEGGPTSLTYGPDGIRGGVDADTYNSPFEVTYYGITINDKSFSYPTQSGTLAVTTDIAAAINELDSSVAATAIADGSVNVLTGVTEADGKLTSMTEVNLKKVATTGSIYDVKEGANTNTGADKATYPQYLIFDCGSATDVI